MKRVRREEGQPRIVFYDKLHVRNAEYTSFESLVVKRVKMLRILENIKPDFRFSDIDDTDEDIESHFYCRLLCAQALWSVKWFTNLEVQLFKRRLAALDQHQVDRYFKESFFRKIDGIDEANNAVSWTSKYRIKNANTIKHNEDMRVHFTKVCDLVAVRKVSVEGGYCKLTGQAMRSCMTNFYRHFLDEKMDNLYEYMLRNYDERLRRLHERVFVESKPVVSVSSIDHCLKYLPPCMDILVAKFRKTRHLKYTDRQALCLFLKDCGVSLDDNIQFMRSIFDVSKDVFDKEYLYNIRHNYGLEGKRANYSAFLCKKVISLSNEPNTCGCPFANSRQGVGEYLAAKGVECPEIEDLMSKFHHQEACTAVLARITNKAQAATVSTPVEYYKEYAESAK